MPQSVNDFVTNTSPSPDTRSRACHAKLNLMLSVGPPAPTGTLHNNKDVSGYHPIASWMVPITLYDDLDITRLPKGSKSTYDIAFADDASRAETVNWPIDKDLAVRAHRALEAAAGAKLPIALKLRKRIPTGAGLGGGSSNAGGTLVALRELFAAELAAINDDAFRAIALSIGSDVAFFADIDPDATTQTACDWPRQAIVEAFGDTITHVQGVEGRVLLIISSISCATKPVYDSFDKRLLDSANDRKRTQGQREPSLEPKAEMIRQRHLRALEQGTREDHFFNDLAKPAFDIEPKLGALATAVASMARQGAHVTGSGSCIFVWPEGSEIAPKRGRSLGTGAELERKRIDDARFAKAREKCLAAVAAWSLANDAKAVVISCDVLA